MANVKYKERSNYFPPDLMRELMEDGKRNTEKAEKAEKKKNDKTKSKDKK